MIYYNITVILLALIIDILIFKFIWMSLTSEILSELQTAIITMAMACVGIAVTWVALLEVV